MSPEGFIEVIRLQAVEQAAQGTLKILRQPPGSSARNGDPSPLLVSVLPYVGPPVEEMG